MPEIIHRIINRLPVCDDGCRKLFIKMLFIFLAVYPFYQYYLFKFTFAQWDLLLFTGVGTLIVGLRIIAMMPDRFRAVIMRLERRQVLDLGSMSCEDLFDKVRRQGDLWARLIGLLVVLALGAAFTDALSKSFTWPRLLLGIAEMIAGYVAGNYLGRIASYGHFGGLLKKHGMTVKVEPSHVDGVGGLKPVGDYYFYQAMVVGIPAIFLAVWWFLFPIWPRDYSYWEDSYLALMSIAFLLEMAAFVLPLWAFHEIMLEQKTNLLKEADDLSGEISELQDVLNSAAPEGRKNDVATQIKEKTEHYWAIENMLTWPVDVGTRHRFKFNNILLFIPILGDITKRSLDWDKLLNVLKSIS